MDPVSGAHSQKVEKMCYVSVVEINLVLFEISLGPIFGRVYVASKTYSERDHFEHIFFNFGF